LGIGKKRIPTLFIETTVFNFYFDGKQGKKQQNAKKLFERIASGEYEAYTSSVVHDELEAAPEEKLVKMRELWYYFTHTTLPESDAAKHLADIYVAKGIIPAKFINDALHIATATVAGLDLVISYNFGHLVKLKTIIGVGLINLREGYKQIGISTPTEVIEYDR
jgi:predicted nucleic acid-binding protein